MEIQRRWRFRGDDHQQAKYLVKSLKMEIQGRWRFRGDEDAEEMEIQRI